MDERTTIGDYEVRAIEQVGAVVRYVATHVVLPRRAVVELVAADAPRAEAMRLLKRACILEALQHPAVPRVFECGRLEGRPWIAIAHENAATLDEELQHRRLEVREALTLLEEMAAFLSYAHARGVLHGNISPAAIVRSPTLKVQRWESASVHEAEVASDASSAISAIDGSEDVFGLGKTVSAALARPDAAPDALMQLLERMLSDDRAMRPTAPEVVTAIRAVRDAIGSIDQVDVDRVIEALADEDESPEIVIEYPPTDEDDDENDEEEVILLERHHVAVESVIVDLDACG